jgi:hypothetical protein
MGLFNTGINVFHYNKETKVTEKYQFGSFENREVSYKRIFALWKSTVPEERWRSNKSIVSESDFGESVRRSKLPSQNGEVHSRTPSDKSLEVVEASRG